MNTIQVQNEPDKNDDAHPQAQNEPDQAGKSAVTVALVPVVRGWEVCDISRLRMAC